MLDKIKNQIKEMEKNIIEKESKKELLEDSKFKKEKRKEKLIKEIDLLESVNTLLQKTSNFAREQSKNQIEQLTTNCMQFIFENNNEFIVEIDELYGKASAEFYILDSIDGVDIKSRPVESRGGGLVDVLSLALRISFLELYKPKINGPLILDEPGKHVSNEYIHNVADFLQKSSEMFNRQVIMVTHNSYLASIGSNSYMVTNVNNTSVVEPLPID